MTPHPQLLIKKDCIHFEVCTWRGSGCSNWKDDPCPYYDKQCNSPAPATPDNLVWMTSEEEEKRIRLDERNHTLDEAIREINDQFKLILDEYYNPIFEVAYVEKNIFEISQKESVKVLESLRIPSTQAQQHEQPAEPTEYLDEDYPLKDDDPLKRLTLHPIKRSSVNPDAPKIKSLFKAPRHTGTEFIQEHKQ